MEIGLSEVTVANGRGEGREEGTKGQWDTEERRTFWHSDAGRDHLKQHRGGVDSATATATLVQVSPFGSLRSPQSLWPVALSRGACQGKRLRRNMNYVLLIRSLILYTLRYGGDALRFHCVYCSCQYIL